MIDHQQFQKKLQEADKERYLANRKRRETRDRLNAYEAKVREYEKGSQR